MDPFQVPKKVSIAPFPNLLTNSSPDIYCKIFLFSSYFQY